MQTTFKQNVSQTIIHDQRVAAIADRYKQRGYQVIQEPIAEQLPDFLREFKPDILAENGFESVIVEVQSYGQVTRTQKLERLAKSVEDHPGWRLELVLSNPPEPAVEEKHTTIGFSEIEKRIENSEQLASTGDVSAAVILLYSALEAALRTGLEGIPASFINNGPTAILKQGIAYGLMDQEDFDVLSRLLPIRNAVAHGFADFVDAELLDKSIHITRKILAEIKEVV